MQFEPSGRPPSGPQRSHWYANVMGSAPDHVPTLEKLADLRAGEQQYAEAIDLVQRALRANPLDGRV